jgi:hypothetical protein
MFGHDNVSVDHEAILATRFSQNVEKPISTFPSAQDRLASVAAAGDEMQVLRAVVAMEISRHPVRLAGVSDLGCDALSVRL